MQPQHPATVRAIPDGPWLPAVIAHQKPDGRWLAELENGALAEVVANDIRINTADTPAMLRKIARRAIALNEMLDVIPVGARESGYYNVRLSLLATIRAAQDAADNLEVSA